MQMRHQYVAPRDPHAEPVCLLDKEWAARRKEAPDAFLALARSQTTVDGGATFRFEATPGLWERMSVFIEEESECCPFFAFEQSEEDGEIVLRIWRPDQAQQAEQVEGSDPLRLRSGQASASTPSRSAPRSPQDDRA